MSQALNLRIIDSPQYDLRTARLPTLPHGYVTEQGVSAQGIRYLLALLPLDRRLMWLTIRRKGKGALRAVPLGACI